MSKYRAAFLAACALVIPNVLAAEPSPLSGDALRRTVTGKTIVITTSMGSLPIAYRGDGTMSGKAKPLGMITGREEDRGHWWVSGDQLCQKWSFWLDNQSYCFTLRVSGAKVHWRRNDGKSGTAVIASR